MQLRIHLLHKTNTYIKRATLFAVALILSVIPLLFLVTPANAMANIQQDQTFKTNVGFGANYPNSASSVAVQSDNKLVILNTSKYYQGTEIGYIMRINADGSWDKSFTANTGVGFDAGYNPNTRGKVILQTDGKILIGASFTTFNDQSQNRLIRLNADGSKDTSFNIGTGFDSTVSDIVVQADGKIVVTGNFANFNGNASNGIARINIDGSLDTSYNVGTGFDNSVGGSKATNAIIQLDGKVVVGGDFITYNGVPHEGIIRLNTDGSNDATFNVGGGVIYPGVNRVRSLALQADGKILILGWFTSYNGNTTNKNFIRINTDGTFDKVFTMPAGNNNASVQSDGKIILSGAFASYNGNSAYKYLLRINPDGTEDSSFNTGTGPNSGLSNAYIKPDGKIIIAGNISSYNGVFKDSFVLINSGGTLDNSFDFSRGFPGVVSAIDKQADGKILVGGNFSSFNGLNAGKIIRLNADGTPDNVFNTNLGSGFYAVDGANVNTIVVQSDGKLLIGGNFTTFNGSSVGNFIRLNSDGTPDNAFNTNLGVGFNRNINKIAIQSDNKILLGGYFSTFNGSSQRYLIRLNPDGTKDPLFNIGSFGANVRAISIQSDNKILVGDALGTYNSVPYGYLIRLNYDGSTDNSFSMGAGGGLNSFLNYNSTVIQYDNKIITGGAFTLFNGVTQNRLIRLNSDGSKDTSFDVGTGFNSTVNAITTQPDGKALVGGQYTSFNDFTQNRLIRLNSDGTKDTSFDIGSGLNNGVSSVVIQPDGKLLVGGSFSSYDGLFAGGIARLQPTPDRDSDGINDSIEDSSPNSGDANQDGTLDSLQTNVSSFTNPITNQPMAIEVDNTCTLSNITNTQSNTNSPDNGYIYPLGLYNFTASCGTVGHTTNFKAYYYNADTTKNYTLRKYNPNTNTHSTIDNATFSVETIANQPVLTATYTITDGSPLDTDNQANGIIVDPAGPALAEQANTITPVAPNTGVGQNKLIIGAIVVAVMGLAFIISYMVRTKKVFYKV